MASDSTQNASERPEEDTPAELPAQFRIAYIPGVSLGKWGTAWKERNPKIRTSFEMTSAETQVSVLREDLADVSFVRMPIDRGDDLHAIPLYSEVPMAVLPKDHELAAKEELALGELAHLHLIQDPAEVPDWERVGEEMTAGTRPDLPAPERVEDAVELVAAGIGFVIIPQSLARLHARKDVVHRPVIDVDRTRIAIAWRNEGDSEELAARVEDFIGVVRGRTANSSRGAAPAEPEKKPAKKRVQQPAPKKKTGSYQRITRKPSAKKRGRR